MIELKAGGKPGGAEKPERADAAANRRQILETANRLFTERGVLAVCMADIAKEAGLGKGTLYRRFANKGELCLSLLDESFREFQNQQLHQLRSHASSGTPIIDQLVGFIKNFIQFSYNHLDYLNEIDGAGVPDPNGNINRPHWWIETTVRALLNEAIQRQEIPGTIDPAYLASALLAPLDSRVFRGHLEENGYTLNRISEGLEQLIRAIRS